MGSVTALYSTVPFSLCLELRRLKIFIKPTHFKIPFSKDIFITKTSCYCKINKVIITKSILNYRL